jgi:hypothetical protein
MSWPDEGSFFMVMPKSREAWPPPREAILIHKVQEGVSTTVTVHPDGHLNLLVTRPDGSEACFFAAEPIVFSGPPRFVLTATWSNGQGSLHVNGQDLNPYIPGAPPRLIPSKDPPVLPTVPSTEHPDGASRCRVWVENRRRKFSTAQPRPGRRLKTAAQEAADLRGAMESIGHLREQIRSGRVNLSGHLAAELRALLHWVADDQPDRNLNPLLLRMAAKADLPLPVYAFPDDLASAPAVLRDAASHFETEHSDARAGVPRSAVDGPPRVAATAGSD